MDTWREAYQKMEKILQAVAVLDVCVNSYCLYYVKRTFNTKQVLNHILFIDAILTVLSCLVIFFAYFMEAKCYLLSLIHSSLYYANTHSQLQLHHSFCQIQEGFDGNDQ